MINRVKQFFRALTAEVRVEENEFIANYLNLQETELFYGMSIVDQRHALDVSYLVLGALEGKRHSERRVLIKAALLHDVGKKNGELTILDRVIIVLMELFLPTHIHRWAREGRGNFFHNRRHAFYVAINHGERGAEFLRGIGSEDKIIELVRHHHVTGAGDWRMKILQDADTRS